MVRSKLSRYDNILLDTETAGSVNHARRSHHQSVFEMSCQPMLGARSCCSIFWTGARLYVPSSSLLSIVHHESIAATATVGSCRISVVPLASSLACHPAVSDIRLIHARTEPIHHARRVSETPSRLYAHAEQYMCAHGWSVMAGGPGRHGYMHVAV